jgi:hypothetical protein
MTSGIGVIVVLCSASGILIILKSGMSGMLYTGTSFQLAAKGVKSLNDDKWYGGQLEWGADPCILTSDNEVSDIFTGLVSTKSHGMGLGLAISRMIIDYHGGKLTAMSDGKDGASFEFVLPIASIDQNSARAE